MNTAELSRQKAACLRQKIELLPPPVLQELDDFVDFLCGKYAAQQKKRPKAGCMKGTFTMMSGDFNEPLEDFRDYQ